VDWDARRKELLQILEKHCAKFPQTRAFPDHRGVAAYSHLHDFGGDPDKSMCFKRRYRLAISCVHAA
jgi:hypothetical protein